MLLNLPFTAGVAAVKQGRSAATPVCLLRSSVARSRKIDKAGMLLSLVKEACLVYVC